MGVKNTTATDFANNLTAIGGAIITLAGNGGAMAMQEPYIYIISFGLAGSAVTLGLAYLLSRRGRKKGRR